jgi:hypothetical protein
MTLTTANVIGDSGCRKRIDGGQRRSDLRSRNGSHAARGGLGQMIRQSGKSMIRDAFRRAYEARKEREGGSR